MHDTRSLTRFSVPTNSTNPLREVIEIDAAGLSMKFQLNEDIAHRICTDLERFLTQTHPPKSKTSQRR